MVQVKKKGGIVEKKRCRREETKTRNAGEEGVYIGLPGQSLAGLSGICKLGSWQESQEGAI